MSGPFDHVCVRCRAAGEKLFLKGEKCFTPKCPIVRRPYGPGMHGQAHRRQPTEYGRQLRQVQELRAIYGLREHQLRSYVDAARRKRGVTAEALIARLESRLDTIVYRLGFSLSLPNARQLVHHGLIAVNGRRVDIPSYRVRSGDVISIPEARRASGAFQGLAERVTAKTPPVWLQRSDPWTGSVTASPQPAPHEVPVDLRSVIEFYAR